MTSICDIVSEALAKQYLSIDAEESLRQLMSQKYGPGDFEAFMALQRAFLAGSLRQESRERLLGKAFERTTHDHTMVEPDCAGRSLSYA